MIGNLKKPKKIFFEHTQLQFLRECYINWLEYIHNFLKI